MDVVISQRTSTAHAYQVTGTADGGGASRSAERAAKGLDSRLVHRKPSESRARDTRLHGGEEAGKHARLDVDGVAPHDIEPDRGLRSGLAAMQVAIPQGEAVDTFISASLYQRSCELRKRIGENPLNQPAHGIELNCNSSCRPAHMPDVEIVHV